MNTDFYQITMAYGHWKRRATEQRAKFQLFYRRPPFEGTHVLACGLKTAIDFIKNFRFEPKDLVYLESLNQFEPEFLDYLSKLRFSGDLEAVIEGVLINPKEPLMQITASMIECQLLETPLLNILNFQSLIATKAARICKAAEGDPVIEFGLRRAQGFDGALSASRAAYIGGCESTSNLEAAEQFGIPVRGTMSHAWVMSFVSEFEAFESYAQIFPKACTVAVDTYDTINGVKNAIRLGQRLKGIRLDSGDLAALSIEARSLLNQAGLEHVQIIASGDLDEYRIRDLKQKKAPINAWGVGTRMVTAFEEPALTGVYKLAAIQNLDGSWRNCHKVSDDQFKSTLPGLLPMQNNLLHPIFRSGECVYTSPSIHEIRDHAHRAA
ncbi:MAG: nicotinate phosphoribosyltransferase [Myxococcaceae bacterium]